MAAECIIAGMTRQYEEARAQKESNNKKRILSTDQSGEQTVASGLTPDIAEARSNLWRSIAKPPPYKNEINNSTGSPLTRPGSMPVPVPIPIVVRSKSPPKKVENTYDDNIDFLDFSESKENDQMFKGLSESELSLLSEREQEIYFKSIRSEPFLRKMGSQNSFTNAVSLPITSKDSGTEPSN